VDPKDRKGDDAASQLELLRELVLATREATKWTREGALPAARARVEGLLDSDAKKRVYQAIAQGQVSVRGLESIANVSRNTAQVLVTQWEAAGIVEPGSNPPKAVFTLAELGIAPPPPKEATAKGPSRSDR
jgi:hypothetical protein